MATSSWPGRWRPASKAASISPISARPMSGLDIVTFGCRLNLADSEIVRAHAAAAGLTDAVIVNTCAVTAEAERQARQAIRRARRERPDAQIIVTGCAVQIDPRLYAAMPEIDRVLGNAEKLAAASFLPAGPAPRLAPPAPPPPPPTPPPPLPPSPHP